MEYPIDIDAAYEAWGANCGPCALAALLGQSVHAVRPFFPGFDRRPYVNVSHMKAALTAAQRPFRSIGPARPQFGLVFIQQGGYAHQSVAMQYRHTHWIAVDGPLVFDVNAPALVSWPEWDRVFPRLMHEAGRSNGTYRIRSGLAVQRVINGTSYERS